MQGTEGIETGGAGGMSDTCRPSATWKGIFKDSTSTYLIEWAQVLRDFSHFSSFTD